MKRLAVGLLCALACIASRADLPTTGALSIYDVWFAFDPATAGVDGPFITATTGATVGYRLSPGLGSLANYPNGGGTWDGKVVTGQTVVQVTSNGSSTITIAVSGFLGNPTVSGFVSTFAVSCTGGTPLNTANWYDSIAYGFVGNTATWTFTGSSNIPSGTGCYVELRSPVSPPSNISLSNYYRGGSLVPNYPKNAGVPTSGAISLDNFHGTARQ